MADLKISAKTFAAIHNDPHLAGTTDLEGNVFYETINFLFFLVHFWQEPGADPKPDRLRNTDFSPGL